jgi:hypothetical protein
MSGEALRCAKHDRVIHIGRPDWAPLVLDWAAVRGFLTGCPCNDPDPVAFDVVWTEILEHLHTIDNDVSVVDEVAFALRMVGGAPLSAWLNGDEVERILRRGRDGPNEG